MPAVVVVVVQRSVIVIVIVMRRQFVPHSLTLNLKAALRRAGGTKSDKSTTATKKRQRLKRGGGGHDCHVIRELKAMVPAIQDSADDDEAGAGKPKPKPKPKRRGRPAKPKSKAAAALEAAKSWLRDCQGVPIRRGECSLPIREAEAITVGSDCTGLGTELVAAELCGIPVKSLFGSDINPDVRAWHKVLHPCAPRLQEDCTQQDARQRPAVDLYVAGPPCQPWSSIGCRRGLDDIRGTVFYHVLNFVRLRRPRAALIENVRGLCDRRPNELRDVMCILKECGYCVTWDVMNTQNHGIPQSRPRVFIVAIRADSCAQTFRFPKALNVWSPVNLFLQLPAEDQRAVTAPGAHDQPSTGRRARPREHRRWVPSTTTAKRNLRNAYVTLKAKNINPDKHTTLVDVGASANFTNLKVNGSPCITASRGKSGGFYITTLKRMTSYEELGRLQGFPTNVVKKLLEAAARDDKPKSKTMTVGHALGNAISVNMLMRLLPRILVAAGLALPETLHSDPWKPLTVSKLKTFRVMPDDLYNEKFKPEQAATASLSGGTYNNYDDDRGEVSVTDIE